MDDRIVEAAFDEDTVLGFLLEGDFPDGFPCAPAVSPLEFHAAIACIPISQPGHFEIGDQQVAIALLDRPGELGANGGLEEVVE